MRRDTYRKLWPRTITFALSANLLCGFLFFPAASSGDAPKAPERPVSVVALTVRKDIDKKMSEGIWLNDAAGIEMTMVLSIPDKEGLAVDVKHAVLTSFIDDKGTNLLKRIPRDTPLQGNDTSPDGHRAKLLLLTSIAPADGATKLALKGTVPVTCGADRKLVRQTDVSLREGTKFKLASLELEVARSSAQAARGSAMSLQLKSNMSLRPIKSIRFFSSSGKEIKSQPTQWGYTGGVWIKDFSLWENADSVTVEADMFTQAETVQIPINLEVGVGLGPTVPAAK